MDLKRLARYSKGPWTSSAVSGVRGWALRPSARAADDGWRTVEGDSPRSEKRMAARTGEIAMASPYQESLGMLVPPLEGPQRTIRNLHPRPFSRPLQRTLAVTTISDRGSEDQVGLALAPVPAGTPLLASAPAGTFRGDGPSPLSLAAIQDHSDIGLAGEKSGQLFKPLRVLTRDHEDVPGRLRPGLDVPRPGPFPRRLDFPSCRPRRYSPASRWTHRVMPSHRFGAVYH